MLLSGGWDGYVVMGRLMCALANTRAIRAQELRLPVPNKPCGFYGCKATLKAMLDSELRSCVKAEVAVLGSLSLISLVVCVDIKQHLKKMKIRTMCLHACFKSLHACVCV